MAQSHDTPPASASPLPGEPERIMVSTRRVACDGGGGALGHPKVWYDMGDDTSVECKYCDRLFVLDPAAASGEH